MAWKNTTEHMMSVSYYCKLQPTSIASQNFPPLRHTRTIITLALCNTNSLLISYVLQSTIIVLFELILIFVAKWDDL